jgi:RHS repeat-associated protein
VSEQKFDTWNRVQEMAYPDGEVVKYNYNIAGKLESMNSAKSGFEYSLVDKIGYDKFEQRVYFKHGNGMETRYSYEPQRRRLSTVKVKPPNGSEIMDNVYTYDLVNNVLALVNNRSVPAEGQGGTMNSEYHYDDLYRLTSASGSYRGNQRGDTCSVTMSYDNLHNIRHKAQTHGSNFPTAELSFYDNDYQYEGDAPHTPGRVGRRAYEYDPNGNLAFWQEDQPSLSSRQISWDEENRMQGLSDDGYMSLFTYDASGERVLKSHGGIQGVFINGAPVGFINHMSNYTIYVNPYLVHDQAGFTKHYYIEGQRVASRMGTGTFYSGPFMPTGITAGGLNYNERVVLLQHAAQAHFQELMLPPGPPTLPNYYGQPEQSGEPIYLEELGDYSVPVSEWPQPPIPTGDPNGPPGIPTLTTPTVTRETVHAGYSFQNETNQAELNRYFFHPDHLGSSSYITDGGGNVRQHIEYMAFGETFVEEHSSTDPQPYLFNGKELDRVTGLYYYGARYYDPIASMWTSVDSMAAEHLSWTPYRMSFQSPMTNLDPDGNLEFPLKGGAAVNKRDVQNGGRDLANTVVRTSTYMDTDRPPGASNPHIGIDYRAGTGTEFHSLGDGVVTDMGKTKKGAEYLKVQYSGGDELRFLHISSTAKGLQVGVPIKEGQVLGKTGATGDVPPHLHVDGTDGKGNQIDPEGKNYGNTSNKVFFGVKEIMKDLFKGIPE